MDSAGFRLLNYHSHTPRCMHAKGTEEEYVRHALDSGYEAIGFADHTPWPYKSDFVAGMRMRASELDGYVAAVRAVERKYAGRIRVHLGLECEAFPEFYPWLREIREEKGIEYFILGNHYDTNDERNGQYFGRCSTPREAGRYADTTIAGMESGLFVYLAHPDLFLERYPRFDADAKRVCREICEAAKRLDLPLEYNLLGAWRNPRARELGCVGYTSREFWEIAAETGNRAIIGVDAHAPEALDRVDSVREAHELLQGLGIEILNELEEVERAK